MSLGHSPSIVTNNLVFYYDMNNTQKSWIGKPTTNLVTPTWSSWGTDGSGQASIGTRTILSSYYCRIIDSASNTRQSIWITGLSASTTYTFSVKYRNLGGPPTLRFQLQAYNGGTYISTMAFPTTSQLGLTNTSDWQTAYYTVTTPANTTQVLWFMQDGDDYTTYTHAFELKEPMCESGSIYSTFVAGTRSNTQAIVDLTQTNTITASSLTYGSNGSFSFGGSDYITVGSIPSPFLAFTVSVWFNSSSVSNYKNPIDCNYSSYPGVTGNVGPRLEQNSAGTLGWVVSGNTTNNNASDGFIVQSSGLLPNTWYNAVITWISGSANTYLNGVPVTINASTPNGFVGTFGSVVIGKGFSLANDRSFIGTISVVQIYNRALTTSEVLQNFNAHRGRYGL